MKNIFTLLTLAMLGIGSAWAASVSDLTAISSNYTFIADNITSNGTVKLTANKLYENGYIFAPTANTVATNKGNSTIDGVSHLNSLRLKNTQDQLCFKVAGKCTVTFYTQSHSSRGIQVGSTAGGTEFGSQPVSTTEWSVEITKGGTVYLSSFSGDFYFAGFKVVFPKPDITTQPISASYQKDAAATALTVVATASAGDLSYQWYSCDDANKTNAAAIDGETSASFTPSTATVGTFYYFCRVTDDNGSSDSNVATITVANAYAPIVTATATSLEVLQYETATLGVTVDAVPAATIQWYSCDDVAMTNAAAIDGATDATYSPSTETVGTYYYYAVATNAQGATSSDVITLTVNEDITGVTFYSWNQGTQSGGTAVASDGESVGVASLTYSSTIRLNGKNDFSDKTVTITLANALKAGDLIKVTAFRNKDAANKQSGFKAKFEKGSATIASSTGLEFVNLNEAVSGTDEYGTEPNTCYFSVPASAAGSKTITMTRSHTATNLSITKIEIYRPAIALDAVLNVAGLLTADEVADKADFSFGVTSTNQRVASDAANAVAVISGKYHNDHGCTGLNVMAKVPGKVKITIGQCTFSKSTITIKNSSNVVVAELTPTNPACWKNSAANIYEFYYGGDATTLTISGMSYCPYVGIQEVDEVPAVEKTISDAGYATFCSAYPLDFTNSGVTAYIATINGTTVEFSEVSSVPANTGVLLKGEAGKKTFAVAASTTDVSANKFMGVLEDTEVDGGIYVLMAGTETNKGTGFYKTTAAKFTVGAHTAYLPADVAGARTFIGFEDATAIEEIATANAENGKFFDLQGRSVAQPTKGLYIVNGKKVIMK